MASTGRKVNPIYKSPICATDKYIKAMCAFAAAAEAEMTSEVYGISVCCKGDLDELYMEYSMLKLQEVYDPEACLPTEASNDCCWAPCSAEAQVEIVEDCLESTNISASLVLLP